MWSPAVLAAALGCSWSLGKAGAYGDGWVGTSRQQQQHRMDLCTVGECCCCCCQRLLLGTVSVLPVPLLLCSAQASVRVGQELLP